MMQKASEGLTTNRGFTTKRGLTTKYSWPAMLIDAHRRPSSPGCSSPPPPAPLLAAPSRNRSFSRFKRSTSTSRLWRGWVCGVFSALARLGGACHRIVSGQYRAHLANVRPPTVLVDEWLSSHREEAPTDVGFEPGRGPVWLWLATVHRFKIQ